MKSIRGALYDLGVDIIGEFNVPHDNGSPIGKKPGYLKILLVSSPLLDFEAMALDRAAAVFFPLCTFT